MSTISCPYVDVKGRGCPYGKKGGCPWARVCPFGKKETSQPMVNTEPEAEPIVNNEPKQQTRKRGKRKGA